MKKEKLTNKRRSRQATRTRTKIKTIGGRLRLSVFRSNNGIYAQIIDDATGKTVVSSSSLELKKETGHNKTDLAKMVGKKLGEKAIEAGIKEVVFDKGRYKYHGRVKALALGAREGGLIF